jgi:hypothetical protein
MENTTIPWEWSHQRDRQDDCPTITNQYGTTIYVQPRRYSMKTTTQHPITDNPRRLQDLRYQILEILTFSYSYIRAPEPLNSLDSHFQLLTSDKGHTIYIHLTNISSHIMRKEIFIHTLLALQTHPYSPTLTWIQLMNSDSQYRTYDTDTIDYVIKVISEAQTKTETLRTIMRTQPPWIYRQYSSRTYARTGRKQLYQNGFARTSSHRDVKSIVMKQNAER